MARSRRVRTAPAARSRLSATPWLAAATCVVLATVMAFANSLSGAFVLDDIRTIVENPHVRQAASLRDAMEAPPQTTAAGRPVFAATLALSHALSGLPKGAAPEPHAFHVGNVLIHILAALTLLAVTYHTLRAMDSPDVPDHRRLMLATTIAVVWAVHPLQTASVTYVVQRAEALMGLCLLLTLYGSIRAHDARSTHWTAAAVLACALGMGSKETMVVAPLLVFAWDWVFGRRAGESTAGMIRRRRVLYCGLAATWLILAALVSSESRPGAVGFSFAGWPWWRYLATQAGVVLHYLRLVVVPWPLVLDYGWPPVPSLVAALPSVLIVAASAILTLVALVRRHPAGFAGLVFFLVLAPTSSVLPIVTEVAAEHRMYVPAAAVIAFVTVAVFRWGRRSGVPATAGLVLATAATLTLGWLTHQRNQDYASEERIWADTISRRPENPRARINYAVVLLAQRRTSEAEPHLRTAVELDARDVDARLALGAALCSSGRCQEGIGHFQRAVEIAPTHPAAVRNFAEALASRGDRGGAASMFRRAVALAPDDVFVLNQASWLLATAPEDDVRDGQAALAMAERAVAVTARRDPTSLDSLAVAYAELGRFAEAERSISEAIAVAERQGQASLAEEFRHHLLRIQARTPVRMSPQ